MSNKQNDRINEMIYESMQENVEEPGFWDSVIYYAEQAGDTNMVKALKEDNKRRLMCSKDLVLGVDSPRDEPIRTGGKVRKSGTARTGSYLGGSK